MDKLDSGGHHLDQLWTSCVGVVVWLGIIRWFGLVDINRRGGVGAVDINININSLICDTFVDIY